jgi:hypothetical protein
VQYVKSPFFKGGERSFFLQLLYYRFNILPREEGISVLLEKASLLSPFEKGGLGRYI